VKFFFHFYRLGIAALFVINVRLTMANVKPLISSKFEYFLLFLLSKKMKKQHTFLPLHPSPNGLVDDPVVFYWIPAFETVSQLFFGNRILEKR